MIAQILEHAIHVFDQAIKIKNSPRVIGPRAGADLNLGAAFDLHKPQQALLDTGHTK